MTRRAGKHAAPLPGATLLPHHGDLRVQLGPAPDTWQTFRMTGMRGLAIIVGVMLAFIALLTVVATVASS
ncbi:hypothetical protein ABH917_003639 [Thermobifida halotolerans]